MGACHDSSTTFAAAADLVRAIGDAALKLQPAYPPSVSAPQPSPRLEISPIEDLEFTIIDPAVLRDRLEKIV